MNRIEYLDVLKGFSIFLVVFCHHPLLSKDTLLGNIIMATAWGAVPCFIMVTGALMHAKKTISWSNYYKQIFRTYVVLLSWKVIYLFIYSKINTLAFTTQDLISYLFFFGSIKGVGSSVMWYMYAYLSIMLFYPVSFFLFRNNGRIILRHILYVLFVCVFLLNSVNVFLIFMEKQGIANKIRFSMKPVNPFGDYSNILFFFILGAFLFEHKDSIDCFIRKNVYTKCLPWFFIIIGISGIIFIKWIESGTFYWGGIYLKNGYQRLPTVLLAIGMYVVFMLCPSNKNTARIAKYLGQNTMGIYYMHFIMTALVSSKLKSVFSPYMSYSVLLNTARTILIIGIAVLITMLLKKVPYLQALVK